MNADYAKDEVIQCQDPASKSLLVTLRRNSGGTEHYQNVHLLTIVRTMKEKLIERPLERQTGISPLTLICITAGNVFRDFKTEDK